MPKLIPFTHPTGLILALERNEQTKFINAPHYDKKCDTCWEGGERRGMPQRGVRDYYQAQITAGLHESYLPPYTPFDLHFYLGKNGDCLIQNQLDQARRRRTRFIGPPSLYVVFPTPAGSFCLTNLKINDSNKVGELDVEQASEQVSGLLKIYDRQHPLKHSRGIKLPNPFKSNTYILLSKGYCNNIQDVILRAADKGMDIQEVAENVWRCGRLLTDVEKEWVRSELNNEVDWGDWY